MCSSDLGMGAARGTRRSDRVVGVSVALILLAAACNLHVATSGAARIVDAQRVRTCEALIVPGARIDDRGEPYDVLRDRLDMACELYARGVAPRIVVSGRGGGSIAEDEVAAMRRYLVRQGVPAAAVCDDPLGLRTLDTMDRASTVYGFRSAIVVTNEFHLQRAVFLAQHRGLDVWGVAAPEQIGRAHV